MELAEPSIETGTRMRLFIYCIYTVIYVLNVSIAFSKCVERGASRIICHPFFLSFGRHVQEDIPALMAAAGDKHPHVTFSIAKPLGVQESIVELIHSSILAANE